MKKVQKLINYLLFFSILGYPIQKHQDTIQALWSSLFLMMSEPLRTTNKIRESKELLGFPDGCLDIIGAFNERLPDESDFFLSDELYQDPLTSQRMIEYRFPKLLNKESKCGFASSKDRSYGENFKTIEEKGGYKIVCRL